MWRGRVEQPLDEQRRRRRTPPCASLRQRSNASARLVGSRDGAHAAAAAAGRRLEHHRVAELAGASAAASADATAPALPATTGMPSDSRQRRGRATLSPNRASVVGRRADEREAGGGAALGERGVLGEEAVAGVDAVAAGRDARPDERLGVEVGGDGVGRRPPIWRESSSRAGCAATARRRRRGHGDRLDAERRPPPWRCGWRSRRGWRSAPVRSCGASPLMQSVARQYLAPSSEAAHSHRTPISERLRSAPQAQAVCKAERPRDQLVLRNACCRLSRPPRRRGPRRHRTRAARHRGKRGRAARRPPRETARVAADRRSRRQPRKSPKSAAGRPEHAATPSAASSFSVVEHHAAGSAILAAFAALGGIERGRTYPPRSRTARSRRCRSPSPARARRAAPAPPNRCAAPCARSRPGAIAR